MRCAPRTSFRRLVAAFSLAATLAGCLSSDPRPVLRMGTVDNAPPLAFCENGHWKGVEAELGHALAARLNMRPVFHIFPPAELDDALLRGEIDVLMGGLPVTDERRTRMDFSSPWLVTGQTALLRPEDLLRFNTDLKIRAVRGPVAVVEGSTGLRHVAAWFPHADPLPFLSLDEAVAALLRRECRMVVADAPQAWWMSLRYPGQLAVAPTLFNRAELAWAFRRGSITLRESTNQALDDWRRDGTLEQVLRRWIPVSP